jgi:hypothetical protein
MNYINKYLIGLLIAFSSVTTQAATVDITIDPANSSVVLGQSFSVDILGNYSDSGSLVGGSLNLIFDPLVLNVTGVTLVAPDMFGGGMGSGAIDNAAGRVDLIGFSDFIGVTGNFTLATIDFIAVGEGSNSALQLEDAMDLVLEWLNDAPPFGEPVTPVFTNGSVTVSAVPIPAAIWLLASCFGLLGLFRRKVS